MAVERNELHCALLAEMIHLMARHFRAWFGRHFAHMYYANFLTLIGCTMKVRFFRAIVENSPSLQANSHGKKLSIS